VAIILIFSLIKLFGLQYLLLIIGVYVLLICLCCWYSKRNDKKEQLRKEIEPCQHGTIGAKFDIQKCHMCVSEKNKREADERARKEEKKRQEEDEKRRKYNEFVRKIRLPEYLKTVDPRVFEHIVCELFRRMGYKAAVTAYRGDSGIDGYLEMDGKKSILQCKRVNGAVGESVLRDLYGTMHANAASSAVIVTTGYVSNPAKTWAEGKPIRIIELNELRELIDRHFHENEIVPIEFAVNVNVLAMCPRCGSPLRRVSSRYGRDFMGCLSYPKCRYTKSIKN